MNESYKMSKISKLQKLLSQIALFDDVSKPLKIMSDTDLVILKMFSRIILSNLRHSKRFGFDDALSKKGFKSAIITMRNIIAIVSDSKSELVISRLKEMSLTELELSCYILNKFIILQKHETQAKNCGIMYP